MSKFICYNRVSTTEQGKSGLGLDSQEQACRSYAHGQGGEVIACFTEVESGKINERPQLQAAFEHAALSGATLVFAKLDRLSRDAAFLLNLKASKVKFIALDCPNMETLDLGMRAIFAQHEREIISHRTKLALAQVKARGKKLGNPDGLKPDAAERGREAGRKAQADKAAQTAERYRKVIAQLQAEGITTLAAIGAALDAKGFAPSRGGQWSVKSVQRLLNRLS